MTNYPAQVVVKVLYQEFPELAKKVDDKIKERLPDKVLHDQNLISDLIQDFCTLERVEIGKLKNENNSRNLSRTRKVLFALILKFYQPELLSKLIVGLVKPSISKKLKESIQVSNKTFSNDIRTAMHHYHLYKDFKENVDQLYNKLIEKYGNDKKTTTEGSEEV